MIRRPAPTHIEFDGGALDGRRMPLNLTAEQIATWDAGGTIVGVGATPFKLTLLEGRLLRADLAAGRVKFRYYREPEHAREFPYDAEPGT